MLQTSLDELTRMLQTAISPVAMISGIGLLVLAMTNRFSHTTDRTRSIAKQIKANAEDAIHLRPQIQILYRRLKIQLLAISFALASVFFLSLLITALFVVYYSKADMHIAVVLLFVLSLISLVLSLAFFIRDMTLALGAIKEEVQDYI